MYIIEISSRGNVKRSLKEAKRRRVERRKTKSHRDEILPKVYPTRPPWCRVESSLFFVATVKGLSVVIDRSSVSP